MTAATAAWNGVVISATTIVANPFATMLTVSFASVANTGATISAWMIPPTTDASRNPTEIAANVGHQRPLTRWKDRPSALVPRHRSSSSAGTATDHETHSHTPGTTSAKNAGMSST